LSDQTKKIKALVDLVPLSWEPPPTPAGLSLLELGLLCVLSRQLTPPQAEKTLKALAAAYRDWNELRVSQVQEFRELLKTRSPAAQVALAHDVKEYLQEVFQKNHGFDLEPLREDPTEASKFFTGLVTLGPGPDHYLLLQALGGGVPISTGIVRVLDRTGVMKRTSSLRKAQANLEGALPETLRLTFGLKLGHVAGSWCDSKKPLCWDCALVQACPHGKKVEKDWKVQQKRLDQQRKRDEERRRKEEERAEKRRKVEEKKRLAIEAKEAQKREREEQRRQREDERRQRVVALERARVEAKKKREAELKVAAKQAAAKKAAAKKAAAKKAASKKSGAKKSASKKTSTRKSATKKAPARKAAPKSKTKSKSSKKAKTTKRPTTKKKAAKKSATKKPARTSSSKKKTKTSRRR